MSPTRYNYFLLLNLEQAVKSITNGRKVIVVNIHEARTPDVAPSELVHPNEALKTRLFFFFLPREAKASSYHANTKREARLR